MPKYRSDLITGNRLPQSTLDALQEFIGQMSSGMRLLINTSTSIKLDTSTEQIAAGVFGLWRWNAKNATVTATHPGGAAATNYPVFIVASGNVISGGDVDTTDYTFGLQILAVGGTPSGTYGGRTITQFQQIGTVVWDGSKITKIDQSVPPLPTHAHWLQGLASARPTATADYAGWSYYATDTLAVSWCDGVTWQASPAPHAATHASDGTDPIDPDGNFGDASDGTRTITTVAGGTGYTNVGGGVYTQTRDMYFQDLTVNNGVNIQTAGYRTFVRGTLTNNGTFIGGMDVVDANGSTQGSNSPSLFDSTGAGGGGTSGVGIAGPNSTGVMCGGRGGNGGNGSPNAGGASTNYTVAHGGTPRSIVNALSGMAGSFAMFGGGNGASGGGDGTFTSGAGGGGGGILIIVARKITGTGIMVARGGAGGTPLGGNTGGGGGGGGGVIYVVHAMAASMSGQTTLVSGGTGGSAHGTGVAGSAGTNGSLIEIKTT